MENICDLAKARTMVGKKLVRAIPDKTEVPILVRIVLALSTLSSPIVTANALVVWQQNSTAIPTVITRLTREMAFRVMLHHVEHYEDKDQEIDEGGHYIKAHEERMFKKDIRMFVCLIFLKLINKFLNFLFF